MDIGLSGGTGLGSLLPPSNEDNRFSIVQADCNVSSKQNTRPTRPCHTFIEIEFRKDQEATYFSYLIFQNFYAHQITIKQFSGKSSTDRKDEANWKTVLKSYTLMQNPHFESDAQNWHIIGTELVSFNSYFQLTSF
jgi:hypothetical protein